MQSKVILLNLIVTVAMLTIGANGVAQEKWGTGGSGGVWDALQNSDSASGSDDGKQECQAQAGILRMKSSMQGDCAAPPATTPESSLKCPDATKSGDNKKDTGGKVKYNQAKGRPNLKGKIIDPAPQGFNDCSSNFSSYIAAMGWRLQPGKDLTEATTTAQLKSILGTKGNPCWKAVSGKHRAGDMFFYNTGTVGHTGLCFDETHTWESTKTAQGDGPQLIDKAAGGTKSDNQGAMEARGGGYFRFNKKNKACVGEPKEFKNEQKIKNCPGVKDGEAKS